MGRMVLHMAASALALAAGVVLAAGEVPAGTPAPAGAPVSAGAGLRDLTPAQAIEQAAEAAPAAVPGLFHVYVRAVGTQDNTAYLNTELDYRDQRNLSVAIQAQAVPGLAARFGTDLRKAFMGRRWRVRGEARRVKIFFLARGRPTDKYYYQTHVDVTDADQLEPDAPDSASGSVAGLVLASGEAIEGRAAPDLVGPWWQWALSASEGGLPLKDRTGANCAANQSGAVWFLAGASDLGPVRRSCTIPAGRHLFMPILTSRIDASSRAPVDCDAARRNAAEMVEGSVDLFAELDGVSIPDPERLRAGSRGCFDPFARSGREVAGWDAADGYWLLLRPLAPGSHTLRVSGREVRADGSTRFTQDIVFLLEVQ